MELFKKIMLLLEAHLTFKHVEEWTLSIVGAKANTFTCV
jgi:hypothetical protein